MRAKSSQRLSLKDFQNRIRGSKNPQYAFSSLRPYLNPADIAAAARWARTVRFMGQGIFPGRFPKDLDGLYRAPVLHDVDARAEISWAGATLHDYSDRIAQFITLGHDFESALLSGNFDDALNVLDTVDNDCGVSLWTIESRFALIQRSKGLEQQKAYVQQILGVRGDFDIVAFISYYLSQRSEESTTPLRFAERVVGHLDAWEGEHALKRYLVFRLTGEIAPGWIAVSDILRHEANSALIDYYDTFLRLSQTAVLSESCNERDCLIRELKRLHSAVSDSRLAKILFLATGESQYIDQLPNRILEADDALIRGQYVDALWCAGERLNEAPSDVSNWYVSVVAGSVAPQQAGDNVRPAFCKQIVETLQSIVCRANDGMEATAALNKMVLDFRLTRFAPGLKGLIERETSSLPTLDLRTAIDSYVSSPYQEPNVLPYLAAPGHYAEVLKDRYGSGDAIGIELVRAGVDGVSVRTADWASGFQAEAFTMQAYSSGDYRAALDRSSELLGSDNSRFRRIGTRYSAHCLLMLGRLKELVSFIAHHGVRDPGVIQMLPLEACAKKLTKAERKALASDVGTPIVLDLYSRYIAENLVNVRAYAYEDFLTAHGCERPSQLQSEIDKIDRKELIYYLRYICVPENMQMSIAFSGSRELDDERLAVCNLLAALDPDNAETYNSEIRDIVRAQTISSGVRHAEQSKIYVDVPAAQRWAERNLRETFSRYQALVKAGFGTESLTSSEVSELLERRIPEHLLVVPTDESFALLSDLFRILLDEVTTNPQFGLDCYLSMRIRHGTLSGQLRSPLVEQNIITQRQSGTSDYQPNEYWQLQLDIHPQTIREVDKRLGEFSRDYDAFIEHIARDLIQIRTKDKPHGWFDFADRKDILVVGLRALIMDITADTTFERFLEMFFAMFWGIVGGYLRQIRAFIDDTLKADLNALFVKLEADLSSITSGQNIGELDSAIRTAQTNAQHALEEVKDWFQLTESATESVFTLDQLVDIGIAIVRKVHRDFEPKIVKHIPNTLPIRGLLTDLSDILFIIFDNIRRHSGLREPEVTITADFSDLLHFRIENDVDEAVQTPDARLRVSSIKESIMGEGYQAAVASEGGTGFIKIRKIIGGQGGSVFPLDFGFTESGTFFVDFSFEWRLGWVEEN
jgi:hypothetical protein